VLFEHWPGRWLPTIKDTEHRNLLGRFATWHVLRKLRMRAADKPLGHSRQQQSRLVLVQSAAFLDHPAARGRSLGKCTQADLDAWYVGRSSPSRRLIAGFLRWAEQHRRAPRLTIPVIRTQNPAPIGQHRRLALIRRMLTDDTVAPLDRVAALLVLLYAQPVSRLTRLTVDDVIVEGDQVLLGLSDPPSPVPEPFADLLLNYMDRWTGGRTRTPPPTPTALYCSPAAARDSHCTRQRSCSGFERSECRSSTGARPPSVNCSCRPRYRSSPRCSATAPSALSPSPPKQADRGRPALPATIAVSDQLEPAEPPHGRLNA